MSRSRAVKGWFAILVVLGVLSVVQDGQAAGFGVKGGVGFLRKEDVTYGGTTNGATLWMVGGYLDLGGPFSSRIRVVPGGEYSSRSATRVVSLSLEVRYQFYQGPKATVFVGMGPGVNLKRISGTLRTDRNTKGSLNIPFGMERKLGKGGVRWILEAKMMIADDERDSAYRFGTGLAFVLK